jgi:enterochelin esterase family protein
MTKDGQGVWSVSQGPLEPNIYTYGFTVDGIRADGPWCRCTYAFGGGRGATNRFTVGAQPPAPWENQNRPAGTLHHERFFSKTQQRMRGRYRLHTSRIRSQSVSQISGARAPARQHAVILM